jgi:hypothetical protein
MGTPSSLVQAIETNVSKKATASIFRVEGSRILRMEAASSFETLSPNYQTTKRDMAEDSNLNIYRTKNFRSLKAGNVSRMSKITA